MSTLDELLDATPRRLLAVIARQRDVPFPRDAPKATLVDLLGDALADPANLRAALDCLSAAERAVLDDLVIAGGRLPRYHVARRHGDLHPYRPWQPDAPSSPWDDPSSPVDRLYFLGLAFWDRQAGDLAIPADLIPLLPTPAHPPQPRPATGPLEPARAAAHDVALLLALLDVDDVRPWHGRWLTPRLLTAWGHRCAVPPAHPEARSERQAGRRRFLHYLAEAGGLVALAGPFLKPTPAGWNWLGSDPATRLRTLWDAFVAPRPEPWRAYRLPGHHIVYHPPILVESVLDALPHHDAGDPAAFAEALLARDPTPYSHLRTRPLNAHELLVKAIVALLTGPLAWLGALAPAPGADPGRLGLTPWGAAWLELADPPAVPPSPPYALGPGLTFTPPAGYPDPLALATLEACAGRLEDGRWRVTAGSLVAALHRGHALPDLLGHLNELADRPLTGQERATLAAWAETAGRTVVRRLAVLETVDPGVIERLAQGRRGRRLIRRTLSRRAVVVDEGKLHLLVRRLTEQEGVPPRVELPPAGPPADPALGRGGAALLWMAAQLYRSLGLVIPLPARMPQKAMEHLEALAEPGDLAAAEAAAERALAAVQDAIDGRPPFPAWVERELPEEETLALIEEALDEGQWLEMSYYTAGRNELTHRVVEPLRTERQGKAMYLIAYCHRAQAERIFRIDRINSIVKVQAQE